MQKFFVLGLGFLAVLAVAVVQLTQHDDPNSLLQPVIIGNGAGEEGVGPLQLVYMPSASLAEQQEQLVAPQAVGGAMGQYQVAESAAPIRYAYVPSGGNMVYAANSPYLSRPTGPQVVRYVPINQLASQQPEVEYEASPYAANPQMIANSNINNGYNQNLIPKSVISKRAKEITALRRALNSAVEREQKYENEVSHYRSAQHKAMEEQSLAETDIMKAKKLKNWAQMEKAAADRLAHVEKMAQMHAAKQNAIVSHLLPRVQAEVASRRVIERRLARAALAAQSSGQIEAMERERLFQDMQIAQGFHNAAQVASLAAKTMQQRAEQMQAQAKQDRATAVQDIKDARASVVGARSSAEKTLKAIRAAMSNKSNSNKAAVSAQTEEQNFARDARMATKEMSSKKRDAKALRQEAVRLDTEARTLSLEAAQRAQVVPSYLAKAHAADAAADSVRNDLKLRLQSSLPLTQSVDHGEQLAMVRSNKGGGEIRRLAVAENKYRQTAALLHKVQKVTSVEGYKALRDEKMASDRLEQAKSRLIKSVKAQKEYAKKISGLVNVLSDAKTELAELETEAKDISDSK